MTTEPLSIEKLTQLLHQHTFPDSVGATLMVIRECEIFSRIDLSMLASNCIFRHTQAPANTSNAPMIWVKTLNNLQELHTLNILRQFLENETDLKISTRVFEILFVEILADQRHPLFTLYYNLVFKLLSLALSFQSKQTLTIFARWFLSIATTNETLMKKLLEQIIHEYIALATPSSIPTLAIVSPLFTLCLMSQTAALFDNENFHVDANTIESLVRLFTYGLTNSSNEFIRTLEQELTENNTSFLSNFLPSIIRLDVLFPLRSFDSSSSRVDLDHFHTAILSFLFTIVTQSSQRIDANETFEKHSFPSNYFEQLSTTIQKTIEREGPEKSSIDECIERYLQIFSICRNSNYPLTQQRIRDIGKTSPLFTRHKLFDLLKHRETTKK